MQDILSILFWSPLIMCRGSMRSQFAGHSGGVRLGKGETSSAINTRNISCSVFQEGKKCMCVMCLFLSLSPLPHNMKNKTVRDSVLLIRPSRPCR